MQISASTANDKSLADSYESAIEGKSPEITTIVNRIQIIACLLDSGIQAEQSSDANQARIAFITALRSVRC